MRMKDYEIITGEALEVLSNMNSDSANTCVTSPPYYGLRDYGAEGQIGHEKSPEEYVSKLVKIFREVKRVLKDDGTLWLNLGDSYAGSGKGAWNNRTKGKESYNVRTDNAIATMPKSWSGLKAKNLIGIPWRVALAIQADGWILRQDIIWHKPNAMPESVKDRCTKSHEYIFLFSKRPKYYFNAESIAEPVAESTIKRLFPGIHNQEGSSRAIGKTNRNMKAVAPRYGGKKYTEMPNKFHRTKSGNMYDFRPLRNKRDVWTVSTVPFKEAHFATFPPELIRPCILAGSREGDIVLDPFSGSGTTGAVSVEEGRRFTGIEINPEYVSMSKERIRNVRGIR